MATEVPGLWAWQFSIDGEARQGRTEARLELLAIRRVKLKIDRALNAKRRRDGER